MDRQQAAKFMQDCLRTMLQRKGSDLFISADFPPACKIDGKMTPLTEQPLTPAQTSTLVRSIMNDHQIREFDATKECNFAINPPGIGRFRVNVFVQQARTGAVLRIIPTTIPKIEELNLPPVLRDLVLTKRGLILVVGAPAPASPRRWRPCSAIATPTPSVTSSPSRTRWSSCTSTTSA